MKRGRPKCTICGERFWVTHPRAKAGECGRCFENPKRLLELPAKVVSERALGEMYFKLWRAWR